MYFIITNVNKLHEKWKTIIKYFKEIEIYERNRYQLSVKSKISLKYIIYLIK